MAEPVTGPRPLAKRATGHQAAAQPSGAVRAHAATRERRTLAVPADVLRQVRLVELRTRGLVNALFTGEYHSVFKGQGMEFA
jgi:hypothetical protein